MIINILLFFAVFIAIVKLIEPIGISFHFFFFFYFIGRLHRLHSPFLPIKFTFRWSERKKSHSRWKSSISKAIDINQYARAMCILNDSSAQTQKKNTNLPFLFPPVHTCVHISFVFNGWCRFGLQLASLFFMVKFKIVKWNCKRWFSNNNTTNLH